LAIFDDRTRRRADSSINMTVVYNSSDVPACCGQAHCKIHY